jgi:N-acetylmuramoyl-L-alanine amidase
VNISHQYLTMNGYSRPGRFLVYVHGIVVHWVGNAGQSAQSVRNYFESLKDQDPGDDIRDRFASTQFIVGLEGEVIQTMPINEMAYHVGANKYTPAALTRLSSYPNNSCIGIEMCHTNWDGHFTTETLHSTAQLVAWLLRTHHLQVKDVWRHYDVTEKVCPKLFVEDEGAWESFLGRVEHANGNNC